MFPVSFIFVVSLLNGFGAHLFSLQVAKPFEGVEGLREVGYLDPDFFVFGFDLALAIA